MSNASTPDGHSTAGRPTDDTLDDEALVTLERYDGAPREAAQQLLQRARATDESMSFGPPPGWVIPPPTSTIEIWTRLHRWTLGPAGSARLAGVITLRDQSPVTVVDIVIAPEFRSTGVATAAAERLLARSPNRQSAIACAYGSHPAALRLAARFDSIVADERHHMVLGSEAEYRRPAASAATPRTTQTRHLPSWPLLDEEIDTDLTGGVGTIDLTGPQAAAIAVDLHHRVSELFAAGARSIHAVVDSDDGATIDLLRSAAFGHDRTDVLIRLAQRSPT